MKGRIRAVGTFLVLAAACSPPAPPTGALDEALGALPAAQVVTLGPAGFPRMIRGQLGYVAPPAAWDDPELRLRAALAEVSPVFRLDPADLQLVDSWEDELGFGHARYAQTVNGLPVVASELRLHVDPEGVVYAANGDAFGSEAPEAIPVVSPSEARNTALNGLTEASAGETRLVYVRDDLQALRLAWEVLAEGRDEAGAPRLDLIFVDARNGALAARHPQLKNAKYRRVYDGRYSTPPLLRQEGQGPVSDSAANLAYDNLGIVYDCFLAWFNRDSWNGAGAYLNAYVHASQALGDPCNAAWVGQAWDGMHAGSMLLGDGASDCGGGYTFANMAGGFDVIAHEITHGVIDATAQLIYENESGALNEAWADIMGATCEAYRDGGVSANTWKIGEQIVTAGITDALRYMDNPTAAPSNFDYWPERCLSSTNANCRYDGGGVHMNSGIANLAYYLAVAGGRHPRNRTTFNVPAVGLPTARAAFYRALTTYLTQNATFQDARAATVQAALDAGNPTAAASIDTAWAAVGVPPQRLQNAIPVTPLAGDTTTSLRFFFEIPSGATNLVIQTSGGTGDIDLYVRRFTPPTTSSFDYKSDGPSNVESITAPNPAPVGTWLVLAQGAANFAGATLVASWNEHLLTPPEKAKLPPPTPTP